MVRFWSSSGLRHIFHLVRGIPNKQQTRHTGRPIAGLRKKFWASFWSRGWLSTFPRSLLPLRTLTCSQDCSSVMSRSSRYGDVTATYIRWSKILSHIYAKHQYRKESEYESTWCIIHSNIWVQLQSHRRMWHNITWILHHRYGANARYKEIYNNELYKRRLKVITEKL